MCCSGGCIGGGDQPIGSNMKIKEKRIKGIYDVDKSMKIRKSHENPAIKKLYEEFLGKPLGKVSHKLLHTSYSHRNQILDIDYLKYDSEVATTEE